MDAKTKSAELTKIFNDCEYDDCVCQEKIEQALLEAYCQGRNDLTNEIDDIIAEFGDDPKACANIIGEHLHGDCSNVER